MQVEAPVQHYAAFPKKQREATRSLSVCNRLVLRCAFFLGHDASTIDKRWLIFHVHRLRFIQEGGIDNANLVDVVPEK
jgi:hypothetical protein